MGEIQQALTGRSTSASIRDIDARFASLPYNRTAALAAVDELIDGLRSQPALYGLADASPENWAELAQAGVRVAECWSARAQRRSDFAAAWFGARASAVGRSDDHGLLRAAYAAEAVSDGTGHPLTSVLRLQAMGAVLRQTGSTVALCRNGGTEMLAWTENAFSPSAPGRLRHAPVQHAL